MSDWKAGQNHLLFLNDDGTVWAIGGNYDGQLGDGTTDNATVLVDTGITVATKIAASLNYSMALLDDGTMQAWGGGASTVDNYHLGTGRRHMDPPYDYRAPARVVFEPTGGVGPGEDLSPSSFNTLSDVTDFWTGYESTWARTSTGLIYMWGYHNVLLKREDETSPGDWLYPYYAEEYYPKNLGFSFVPDEYSYPFTASTIFDIQFGWGFGIMLLTDGSLVSFGMPNIVSHDEDDVGLLGRPEWSGLVEERDDKHYVPRPIPSFSGVQQIACGYAHTVALKSDGTVWSWGKGLYGRLGTGSGDNAYEPTRVVGEEGVGFLSGIVQISCGEAHTLALDGEGTVWAWGQGEQGQLGDGTNLNSNIPVRVGVLGDAIEFNACRNSCDPGDVEPLPAFEDDPIITQPSAAKISYEPEKFPDVDVTLPDAPLIPGDPFEFEKPRSLDPPEPFNANQLKVPTPSADPCNSGMPAPGGGVCSPTNPADTPIAQNPTGAGENLGGFKQTPGVDLHGVGKGGGSGSQESKYFSKDTCYKNEEVNVIIVKLSTLLKLDPAKVQVNEDCDERYTGCFKKGSNIFDALKKMANICGGVFNPGDGGGVVTPPTPKDVHHYLSEYSDIFYLERLYDNQDNFAKVEVFRPPKGVNGVYYPGVSKVADVSTPFNPDLESVKTIYTYDYNLTDAQIQNMANVEASKTSGSGARCQITVLYDDKYKLYQQLHLQRPSINWYTNWMIRTIAHTFSINGQLTVMEATYLGSEGAPVGAMMDEVLLDPVAVGFSLAA